MSDAQIRPYSEGDEHAILELYAASYPAPISLAYWRWRYLQNPIATPMIELAFDAEGLAGHYAVSPVLLDNPGAPLLTGLSMTTMTHPRQRGRGLFPRLAASLNDRLTTCGFELVWGFPNHQSHRQFIASVGWQDVERIPVLRLDLADQRVTTDAGKGTITEETDAGPWVDRIFEQSADRSGTCIQRSERFLRWRLFEEPTQNYRCLLYTEGAEPIAYVVFKRYKQQTVNIVDHLCIRDHEPTLQRLLQRVIEIATGWGAHEVTTWCSTASQSHGLFERLGFRLDGPVTYLAGKPLQSRDGHLLDPGGWRTTMLHSDVF